MLNRKRTLIRYTLMTLRLLDIIPLITQHALIKVNFKYTTYIVFNIDKNINKLLKSLYYLC